MPDCLNSLAEEKVSGGDQQGVHPSTGFLTVKDWQIFEVFDLQFFFLFLFFLFFPVLTDKRVLSIHFIEYLILHSDSVFFCFAPLFPLFENLRLLGFAVIF